MSAVELSLQLQIQDIAAVTEAFSTAVSGRHDATLWWLVDYASNIIYENRVKGSSIIAIDDNIATVNIGSSIFGDWFNLQNAYFAQDQPLEGVLSLKNAIEIMYRWRVPQYFNDVAVTGNGQGIQPQYVFPHVGFNVGTYEATSGTAGTYTKGVGPLDSTLTGPGILQVAPIGAAIGAATLTLALTAVYSDGTTGTIPASIPNGSATTTSFALGGSALTAAHTGATGNGVVSVAATTTFRTGTLVVIVEDKTGTTPFLWATEVAEVVSIGSGQLTLRQPTPPGAANPFPNGLRNNYTTAATVYPLFTDVTAVTNSTGTAGDEVQISFRPDWPQGFVNVNSISTPQ
jgi:hypothetical protein